MIPDSSKNNRKRTSLTNIAARAFSLGIRVGGKEIQLLIENAPYYLLSFDEHHVDSLILKFGLCVCTESLHHQGYCSSARINLSSVIDAACSQECQRKVQKAHNILLMLHCLGEAGD